MPCSIDFDPEKNAVNFQKHGISLADAHLLNWDEAITWPDLRKNYGESRMIGLGVIEQRLYVVVFVDREDHRRIISLRRANLREVKRYAQT